MSEPVPEAACASMCSAPRRSPVRRSYTNAASLRRCTSHASSRPSSVMTSSCARHSRSARSTETAAFQRSSHRLSPFASG
eukprot:10660495-Lingulodinium_polyedra.AAC.1